MAIKLTNNAASVLAGNITSTETTITVASGDGAAGRLTGATLGAGLAVCAHGESVSPLSR